MDDRARGLLQKVYRVRALTKREWVPAILAVLSEGPMHYTELLTTIRSLDIPSDHPPARLSEKMLNETLRQMHMDELLTKETARDNGGHVTVTYDLTQPAKELLDTGGPTME